MVFTCRTYRRHGVVVRAVPLVQQTDVVSHGDQHLPQHGQLAADDVGGDGTVAILLGAEVDEVGPHGEPLAVPELRHAQLRGHVLVGHLVPHPPPDVHHLELQPVLLAAVLLDLRIDVLHQGVSLHQHVRKGGAGEDADDLGADRGQLLQAPREDAVHRLLVHDDDFPSLIAFFLLFFFPVKPIRR